MKPRLLEGCPCEGGSTAGYQRAGWHVTAVDLNANRLKYNPADEKVHGDAIDYIRRNAHRFDAVHVSPNCQWYTRGRAKDRGKPTKWERSIPTFREAILETGLPYVIENVRDAAWDMVNPALLCGCMFELSIRDFTCTSPGEHAGTCDTENGVTVHLERGRMFETNWGLAAPRACEGEGRPRNNHPAHDWVAGAYGGARRDKYEARYIRKGGYVPPDKELVKALLGIEHDMTWAGLFECLPPAYTEWIGTRLAEHVSEQVAA